MTTTHYTAPRVAAFEGVRPVPKVRRFVPQELPMNESPAVRICRRLLTSARLRDVEVSALTDVLDALAVTEQALTTVIAERDALAEGQGKELNRA